MYDTNGYLHVKNLYCTAEPDNDLCSVVLAGTRAVSDRDCTSGEGSATRGRTASRWLFVGE